jgi:hypothetical protein
MLDMPASPRQIWRYPALLTHEFPIGLSLENGSVRRGESHYSNGFDPAVRK